jgi:hypothetical protein
MFRPVTALLLLVALLTRASFAQEPGVEPEPEVVQAAAEKAAPEKPASEMEEDEEAPDIVKLQQEVYWAPPGAGSDEFTWIKLKSGEWQRGEIKDLHDGVLSFDSDELDDFTYDWVDVRAVISGRPHTVTTWEPVAVHTGFIVARRGSISIVDAGGEVIARVDPDNVHSMIQGLPREANFWSGEVGIGSTIRAGNSDQSDLAGTLELNRRALSTRWDNKAQLNYSTSGGAKTQESHRYNSTYDWFISRQWFVTVAEYEYFRDPFQNIAQRHIPGAGVGHNRTFRTLDLDWTAVLAWQQIAFVSVPTGQERVQHDVTLRFGMTLEWDITNDIEYDLDYDLNVPFAGLSYYSSNLVSTLSLDLFRALDLDLTVDWDRQNKPREDENGNLPKKDDVRLITGLSWEF